MVPSNDNGEPVASQGYMIRNLNIALIVVTSVIMMLRLYARGLMTKAFGLDDFIAIIACALIMTLSAMELVQVKNGSGTSMDQLDKKQLNAFFSTLPINQLLFVFSCGIARLSVLAFLPRLSKDRIYMRYVWAVGFVIVGITLANFFVILTECRPIGDLFNASKPNRDCISRRKETYMMWTQCIVGICIDLALFGLPIWVIHNKMIRGPKAVKVILVFCVGLFAIITGIVRFGFIITTDYTTNTTYKMIRIAFWSLLEVHVGLWCGSFPALQPFLRLVSYKLGLRSSLGSTDKETPYTRTGAQSLSDWPSANGYIEQISAIDREENDGASGRIIVAQGDSTTEFVELDDIDNGIRLQTDIHVQAEEGVSVKEMHGARTMTWDAI